MAGTDTPAPKSVPAVFIGKLMYTFRRISSTMVSVIGSHITINMWNKADIDLAFPFGNAIKMLLKHYDKPEHKNDVLTIGSSQFVDSGYVSRYYPGKSLITIQTEPLLDAKTWIPVPAIVQHLKTYSRIWDHDYDNAAYLRQHGIIVEAIMPVRYTPELIDVPDLSKDIDVIFYGSVNVQRMMTLARLQGSLFKKASLVWGFSLSGQTLLDLIGRSKIVLNICSTTPGHQEQSRIIHAIMNKKCVISQRSKRNYFPGMIIECDDPGQAIIECLASESWRTMGVTGHDMLLAEAKKNDWL